MINTREVAKEYRLTHWAGIMQERVVGGMNIREYCKHIGICENTYYYWQRRLRATACEHLAVPVQKSISTPSFAEIKVEEPPALPTLAEAVQASQIHIDVHGIQITLDSTYPTDKLAALLRELVRP